MLPKEHSARYATCQITGKRHRLSELVPGTTVRKSLQEAIRRTYANWDEDKYISINALNQFRLNHVRELLQKESDATYSLEQEVINSLNQHTPVSKNVEEDFEETLSLGDKLADRLTETCGSWPFIVGFFLFLAGWVALNTSVLFFNTFDPYPFIFLNLILSCLAAIQAPIIMMSQNRQAAKDRAQSEHDYQVNLKAELEIQMLNEKMDHSLVHFSQILLEIQQIQTEFLEEISHKINTPHPRTGKSKSTHK